MVEKRSVSRSPERLSDEARYGFHFLRASIDSAERSVADKRQIDLKALESSAYALKSHFAKTFQEGMQQSAQQTLKTLIGTTKELHGKDPVGGGMLMEQAIDALATELQSRAAQVAYDKKMYMIRMPDGAERRETDRKLSAGKIGSNECVVRSIEMVLADHGKAQEMLFQDVGHSIKKGASFFAIAPNLEKYGVEGYHEDTETYLDNSIPEKKEILKGLLSADEKQACILHYREKGVDMTHVVVADFIDDRERVAIRDPNRNVGAIFCPLEEVAKRWSGAIVAHKSSFDHYESLLEAKSESEYDTDSESGREWK